MTRRAVDWRDDAGAYALWATTFVTLVFAVMTWAGGEYGVPLTYWVFWWAVLMGVLVTRRWTGQAPIRHYGAVIDPRTQPVVYHLSMFALLCFTGALAAGAMLVLVASKSSAMG